MERDLCTRLSLVSQTATSLSRLTHISLVPLTCLFSIYIRQLRLSLVSQRHKSHVRRLSLVSQRLSVRRERDIAVRRERDVRTRGVAVRRENDVLTCVRRERVSVSFHLHVSFPSIYDSYVSLSSHRDLSHT